MSERYVFRMRLNQGMAREYERRHDEIWPELVALLKKAGVSDYSIHLDTDFDSGRRGSGFVGNVSNV